MLTVTTYTNTAMVVYVVTVFTWYNGKAMNLVPLGVQKNDTSRDPKINPKSFDLGTSKRYLKITFVYLEMDPKWGKKIIKKNIVL